MHCSSIMKRSIEDREHSELLHGPLRWEGGFSNGSCIPGRRCFSPMEPPVPMALIVVNPVDEGTKRRVTDTPVHHSVKAAGSTHSSTRGLSSHEQLERQAEFHSSTQDEA